MKTLFNLFLQISLVFAVISCGNDDQSAMQKQGKGDVWYGGILKMQSLEKVDELFPHGGTNKFTRDITYQIFESLLRLDTRTMQTIPNIAKNYKVSEDGLTYTLDIRKDVYFQPNACFKGEIKLLTAKDVKFSLDLACSGLSANKSSFLLINRVKGAKEYNKKTRTKLTKNGVSGIKVSRENQITIELIEPFAGFEKVLTHSNLGMVAQEAFEMYGKDISKNPVGTGPFMLEKNTAEFLKLKRFPKYWKKDRLGNQLPYLDGFEMRYYSSKQGELADFQNSKTDIVLNIPAEEINHLLGTLEEAQNGENVIHKVFSEPSMSVSYIGFANQSKECQDVRVRRALIKLSTAPNWLMHGWEVKVGQLQMGFCHHSIFIQMTM